VLGEPIDLRRHRRLEVSGSLTWRQEDHLGRPWFCDIRQAYSRLHPTKGARRVLLSRGDHPPTRFVNVCALQITQERTPARFSIFVPPDVPPRCRLRSKSGVAGYSGRSRKPLTAFRSSEGSNPSPSAYALRKPPICSVCGGCRLRLGDHSASEHGARRGPHGPSRARPRVRTIAQRSRPVALRAMRKPGSPCSPAGR
jgi:hypothetical protein